LSASLHLAVSDLLERDRGPGPSGAFEVSPTFFIVLFGVGFLVGTLGHLIRSRTLVVLGVGMVFLATVLLPLYYNIWR
jgi:hypothetical protein